MIGLYCKLGDMCYVSWEICVMSARRYMLCQLGEVSCQLGYMCYVSREIYVMSAGRSELSAGIYVLCQLGDICYISREICVVIQLWEWNCQGKSCCITAGRIDLSAENNQSQLKGVPAGNLKDIFGWLALFAERQLETRFSSTNWLVK